MTRRLKQLAVAAAGVLATIMATQYLMAVLVLRDLL